MPSFHSSFAAAARLPGCCGPWTTAKWTTAHSSDDPRGKAVLGGGQSCRAFCSQTSTQSESGSHVPLALHVYLAGQALS